MIDRFRLDMAVDLPALLQDLHQLDREGWTPHFNRSYYEGTWSGLTLRSPGGQTDSLYCGTMEADFQDTPVMQACPGIARFLAGFQCPLKSVRLLRLAAGSQILEHRDYDLGADQGEVRLHIPILTHAEVQFHLNNQRVQMQAGEVWYLDLGKPHRVHNPGPGDRIHLVVDAQANDWLAQQIPLFDPDPRLAAIAQATQGLSHVQSLSNLKSFQQVVLSSPEIQQDLFVIRDRQLFIEETQRHSLIAGLPVLAETVTQTMLEGSRRWQGFCNS